MTFFNPASRRFLLQSKLLRNVKDLQAKRNHHPDPFNPKTTRGWKAALMVRMIAAVAAVAIAIAVVCYANQ
jgi:hypothetical protein